MPAVTVRKARLFFPLDHFRGLSRSLWAVPHLHPEAPMNNPRDIALGLVRALPVLIQPFVKFRIGAQAAFPEPPVPGLVPVRPSGLVNPGDLQGLAPDVAVGSASPHFGDISLLDVDFDARKRAAVVVRA